MKLQFTHQDYQMAAVQAVVDCFEGQSLAQGDFEIAVSVSENNSLQLTTAGIANHLILNAEQLLENIQAVQKRNLIPVSEKLEDSKKEGFWHPNISVEMETGTGKTYTFLRTIYELHKIYGFKKYIIAVPSIAIREGILKNLQITHEHFQVDYQNASVNFSLYDPKNISALRQFASSNAVQILVMNIDSFAKDSNIINTERESGAKPIEFLQATRPIVIIDEPQNFETDLRKEAIHKLHPLCTLRYSATHKNAYNLVYSLNPVQAYDLGLVKQIEVDSITSDHNYNIPFIQFQGITAQKNNYKAKVIIHVNTQNGIQAKALQLKNGDDLFELSGKREVYNGYILTEISWSEGYLEFDNGIVIHQGQTTGGLNDEVMRLQIERTVKHHFERTKRLKDKGIKVLSLFFIDKVANYRTYQEGEKGKSSQGKFAIWLEEAFCRMQEKYPKLIDFEPESVHNGYFSSDKSTKVWTDSKEKNTAQDTDTYNLIMKDKEKLLDLNEPLQFIFSHSALREGWDNPNVFQICTLNQSKSEMKKRQEIGRGLRLPVNQKGERIQDKNQNILTVIANESYEEFAETLQKEMKEAGVDFTGKIKKSGDKKKIQSSKAINPENYPLLYEIWNRIAHKTRYSVAFETEALIQKTLEAFRSLPPIKQAKLQSNTYRLNYEKNVETVTHIGGNLRHSVDKNIASIQTVIPDIYNYIQNKVNVTRNTIYQIITQSKKIEELALNPQLFLDQLIQALKQSLQALQVEGIKYEKINGQSYEMSFFKDEEIERYIDELWTVENTGKTIFNYIPCDSETEKIFARACNADENVLFYFKIPKGFKIPTPLGFYIPDWAIIVKEEDKPKIYFVIETKSTLNEQELRGTENFKIKCAKKHFALSQDQVRYQKATILDEVY